jgi:hypothetical protein
MIIASGGFTKGAKRGDHPQPLTKEDEDALNRAWASVKNSTEGAEKQKTKKRSRVKI